VIKRLLSRLSIRVTAPVLLVLPVLLAAGVLTAIGTIQGRAAVERLASQQLAQIHDQINQHVDSLASMPARVDQANVALIESGRFDPAEPRDWGPVIVEQFRAFEALSAITWGGEDGQCTWIARYVGDDEHLYYAIKDDETGEEIVEYHVDREGRIAPEPAGSFAFDPRIRPWYVAPKQAGRPAWSEPFLWVGGSDEEQATLGIAYGWPYFDDHGGLVGIIDADLSLQDISRYLSGLRIGRTGRAYLVDDEGLMLASSTAAALANDAGERLHAASSDEVWIEASAQHLATAFGSVGSVDLDHEEIIEIAGLREWLRASPFIHDTGLNWVIVTLVPETDFMAEIMAGRRRSAWFTAGVTLGTLGIGVLLAMLLVRPIVDLSHHVRRLGEGELDREVSLPYARELVRLSDDINQMTADLRDRMALRRSLALAMEVQQSLLPSETPRIEGLDIAGHSTYCDETGGDYYDYLEIAELANNTAALVVGDVMGHGIAAAMLMATARGILRSRCTESGSLGELLGHLNNLLVEVTGGKRFMTMVLVTIDGERGELRLSSAGHDPPFIYDPNQDTFIELDTGGLPLGIMQGEQYPEATCGPLPPGSVILASTDGVWEAMDENREQFGKERILEILRKNGHCSASDIARALRDGVQAFCGEARQPGASNRSIVDAMRAPGHWGRSRLAITFGRPPVHQGSHESFARIRRPLPRPARWRMMSCHRPSAALISSKGTCTRGSSVTHA
jgi:serine phosphatase RsbU (regulator of sigma subunit)